MDFLNFASFFCFHSLIFWSSSFFDIFHANTEKNLSLKKKKQKNNAYESSSDNESEDGSEDSFLRRKLLKKEKKKNSNSSVSQRKGKHSSKHSGKSVATITTKASKGSTVKSSSGKSHTTIGSKKKKKKKKKTTYDSEDDGDSSEGENQTQLTTTATSITSLTSSTANFKEPKKKRKQKSVDPPAKELLAWVMGMSDTKQRSKIANGMRVKVRFRKPKLKWYGGSVTQVSATGAKIRIQYDDGTKEIADFPDNEIIVDDCGNGRHKVDASAFQPKELLSTSIPLSVPTKKIIRVVNSSTNSNLHQSPMELLDTPTNDNVRSSLLENNNDGTEKVTKLESFENTIAEIKRPTIDDKGLPSGNKIIHERRQEDRAIVPDSQAAVNAQATQQLCSKKEEESTNKQMKSIDNSDELSTKRPVSIENEREVEKKIVVNKSESIIKAAIDKDEMGSTAHRRENSACKQKNDGVTSTPENKKSKTDENKLGQDVTSAVIDHKESKPPDAKSDKSQSVPDGKFSTPTSKEKVNKTAQLLSFDPALHGVGVERGENKKGKSFECGCF